MLKNSIPVLLATVIIFTSCSVMCSKKAKLTHTVWRAETKIFVADAGTQTSTYTLYFLPGKKFRLNTKSILPSHPAMYMNPDGTMDMEPERNSEWDWEGTYSYKGDTLILSVQEDDFTLRLHYMGDSFESSDLMGDQPGHFTQITHP